MPNDDLASGPPLVREPGFTTIPNAILEALSRTRLSSREQRTALAIARLTFGYQLESRTMGAALVASVTGIDVREQRRVLVQLEQRGIVRREPRRGQRGHVQLVKDPALWEPGAPSPRPAQIRSGPRGPDQSGPRGPDAKETSKERREPRAQARAPAPQGDLFQDAEVEAWQALLEAMASYGIRSRAKLATFAGLVRARLAEHHERGPGVLAEIAHGYIAMDLALGGPERKRWAYFTPRTLLKRGNAATYLEHHDRRVAEGDHPPFGRAAERRARIAQERRSAREQAEQAEADVTNAAFERLGPLWAAEWRALLRKRHLPRHRGEAATPEDLARLEVMELELERAKAAARR